MAKTASTKNIMEIVSAIIRSLSNNLDIEQAFPDVVQGLRSLTGCERVSIALANETRSHFTMVVLDQARPELAKGTTLPIGASAAADDILTGRPHLTLDLVAEVDYPAEKTLYEAGYRSRINIPLIIEERAIGALNLVSRQRAAFSQNDLPVLQQIADTLAIAIENSRLFLAEKKRARQLEAIHQVGEKITAIVGLEDLFATIVGTVSDIFGYHSIFLVLVEGNDLVVKAGIMEGKRVLMEYREPLFNESNPGRVLTTGRSLVINDVPPGEWDFYNLEAIKVLKSVLIVPIVIHEQTVGFMAIGEKSINAFDETDRSTFENLAGQVGIAIQNARLFAAERKRARQLEAIHKVGEKITAIVDLDKLYKMIVETIRNIFGYESIYIVQVDGNEVVAQAGVKGGKKILKNFRLLLTQRSLTATVVSTGSSLIAHDVDKEPNYYRFEEIKDLKSMIMVPIKINQEVTGVLGIGELTTNAFDETDRITFENLAEQIGIAIQNARLFAAEKKRTRQLDAIRRIGKKITAVVNLEDLFPAITKTVYDIFLYHSVFLVLVEGNDLVVRAGIMEGKGVLRGYREPLFNESNPGRVLTSGRSVIINDIPSEEWDFYNLEAIKKLKSVLIVPIMSKERAIGFLAIAEKNINAFDETDRITFENLAEQIGIAIQNARLFATEEKRLKQLEAIRKVNEEITAILDLDHLLPAIATTLKETFGLYHTYIFLVEGNTLVMRAVSGTIYKELVGKFRIAIGENSINSWVARTGKPLMVNDVSTEPRYYHLDETKETRAELAVPIKQKGRIIGTIGVIDVHPNAFDETDLQTFQNVATQIGIAIENARLYEQTVILKKLNDAVIENLVSGVMYVDNEGKVIICNRSMAELLGVGARELIGTFPRLMSQALETPASPFQQVLKSGQPLVYHETKFKKTDGTYLTVGMSITPLTDEEKTIIGAVGLFVDLTPLKTIEAEQRHVRDLALLGGTVTRLAHEIKNPLAAILSGIQLLERRLEPKKEQRVYFDAIVTEIQRLDSCLKELLVFSKPKEPEFSNENPLLPLENALKLLEPQLTEHQIRLVRDFDPAPPYYRMDPQKMMQVFLNLMLNAIQASPPGGSIRVSVRSVISSPLQANDGFSILRYEITDFGSGISKENLEKIFDPFFSTKTQGIGLGLTIVRRIVEEHGGTITVKSKPGEETTFIVRLMTEKA